MKTIRSKTIYLLLPAIALLAAACNKYLGVQPKGEQVLTTATDYDEWLNQTALYASNAYRLDNMANYYDNPKVDVTKTDYGTLIYLWKPSAEQTIASSGTDWAGFYTRINLFNTVIANVDYATGAAAQKTELKAEALLGRANEYLYLVNLYGREYDPATAAQDLAVPFVTSNDIAKAIPPRSTVGDLYNDIINDLNTAIPNLPASNATNRFRGSVYAAYSILARAYFYKRDYPNAEKFAQLALQDPSLAMRNYNTPGVTSATAYPNFGSLQVRSDVIYARYPFGVSGTGNLYGLTYSPTLDFINAYDAADLRLNLMKRSGTATSNRTGAQRGDIGYYIINGINYAQNAGTGVSEMKLIIAEAAARTNDLATALAQVNDLRKYRFPPASYQALASGDQATVLGWVLRERGFELPFNGLRWLDMRRLDAEGINATYYRYDGLNAVIGTLTPHSDRFVLQIPYSTISFHTDWQQNP